jgi:hypothetical protein
MQLIVPCKVWKRNLGTCIGSGGTAHTSGVEDKPAGRYIICRKNKKDFWDNIP